MVVDLKVHCINFRSKKDVTFEINFEQFHDEFQTALVYCFRLLHENLEILRIMNSLWMFEVALLLILRLEFIKPGLLV